MEKRIDNTDNFQFPALTGIRALAAVMVFLAHLPLHLYFISLQYFQYTFGSALTLFFVLSGFLITYTYYNTFQISAAWFKAYFVKRFARIYPVYFLLVSIVMLFKGPYHLIYFIQNYLFVAGFVSAANLAIGPSWSLTVEICYYALAPFIILIMRRYNALLPLLLYIITLAVIIPFCSREPDFFTANNSLFMSNLTGRFFEFFIGGFAAVRMMQGRYRPVRRGIKYTTIGFTAWFLTLGIMTPGVIAGGPTRLATILFSFTLIMPFIFVLLIYGLITETSKIQKVLSNKTVMLLGHSSYALYLIHVPVILYVLPVLRTYHKVKYDFFVLVVFIIIQALAVFIYKYYEAPMNNKIKKWLLKPKNI